MDMEENEELTFGRYLAAVRKRNGIAIEEVEQKTNIGKNLLLTLENEDYANFPAPVYVMGFLRAHALAVGADGDEVIRLYRLSNPAHAVGAKGESEYLGAGSGFWPRLLLTLVAVLMIVGGAVYFMNGKKTGDSPVEKADAPAAESPEKAQTPPAVPETAPVASETVRVGENVQVMKVVCVEDTWMKVITDGKKPVEYDLKEGDAMTLHGEKGFNLLIGNGHAVKVLLNGKPVPVSGKNGQAVNIELP